MHKWVNCDLKERFKDRIVNFDLQVATIWGKIQARSESAGKAMPAIDGMIAAIGIANDFIIVTRNTSDMKISGACLLDPWLPTH